MDEYSKLDSRVQALLVAGIIVDVLVATNGPLQAYEKDGVIFSSTDQYVDQMIRIADWLIHDD